MVQQRFVKAGASVLPDETVLTAARADGTGGGSLSFTFFPAAGTGGVVVTRLQGLPTSTPPDDSRPDDPVHPGDPLHPRLPHLDPGEFTDLPTSRRVTVGSTLTARRRPIGPRVIVPRFPGDLLLDQPADGIDVPSPEPAKPGLRIEVGPIGGTLKTTDVHGNFKVPGEFGATGLFDPFDDEAQVHDVSQVRRTPKAQAVTGEVAWQCQITNLAVNDVKLTAQVLFTVRRLVSQTRIPLARFVSVFQGALRGLTPIVSVSRGNVVVRLPTEFADEFGVEPVEIDWGAAEATNATVQLQPVRFEVIRLEVLYREAFNSLTSTLKASPVGIKVKTGFVERMVKAAVHGRGSDLLALAADEVSSVGPIHVDSKALAEIVAGGFDQHGIPRRTVGLHDGSAKGRSDDLVMRVVIAADQLSAGAEAAIGAADVLLEKVSARLNIFFSSHSAFEPHPLSDAEPGSPDAGRHRDELTSSKHLLMETTFTFNIADVDIDINLGGGWVGQLVEEVVTLVANRFDWFFEKRIEGAVRDAVRTFLVDNKVAISERSEATLLEIVQRGHVLHAITRDDRDLIVEHYDPLQRRRRTPPTIGPQTRPVGRPIDGPMPDDADAKLAAIEHIVVVMMENRSFDHVLGWTSHPSQFSGLRRTDIDGYTGKERVPLGEGVTGRDAVPDFNPQAEWRPDPDHGTRSTALQVGDGSMTGCVAAYRERLDQAAEIVKQGILDDERRILQSQTAKTVPFYAYLVEEFCVLDRWFASFPGPTFVNRMCALAGQTTGQSNGDLMPDLGYLDAVTYLQLLDRANVEWRLYENDMSFARAFDRYRVDFRKLRPFQEFLDGGRDALPPVTLIDPNVTGMPSEGHASDDHPPTNVAFGQQFLASVLERLRRSVSWPKTLLLITYDEHGGFYDHVAPPGTSRFHATNKTADTALPRVHPDQPVYGVRVPAFVVSPLVDKRSVGHHIYDHTTIARTILQRFAPEQIVRMPARVRRARHLGELLLTERRLNIPKAPAVHAPTAIRLRSSRANRDGFDLAKRRADPDDTRELLSRIGSPRPTH